MRLDLAAEAGRAIAMGRAHLDAIGEDCVGGAYWFRVNDDVLGVFKPADEEAGSSHNTKGKSSKAGFTPGAGVVHEVLAYALDYKGFANVPETCLINVPAQMLGRQSQELVMGSLQRFVPSEGQVWDHMPMEFTVSATHRIGILDLRLLNCDRHGGNLLAVKDGGLVPIDHGYCAPTSLDDLDSDFDWLMWPQAKQPFSAAERAYIAALNPSADADVARTLGCGDAEAELLQAAGTALQIGCRQGMTLRQLADYWCSATPEDPSKLARLIAASRDSNGNIDWGLFRVSAEKDMIVA